MAVAVVGAGISGNENVGDSNENVGCENAGDGNESVSGERDSGGGCTDEGSLAITANTITSNFDSVISCTNCCDNENDLGVFVGELRKQLNKATRIKLLQNTWEPEATFNFPASGTRKLKFQYKWLHSWNWLAYSQVHDGALCKYCVLFAPEGAGIGSQKLGKFVKVPFNNWKKAIEEFKKHEETQYHKGSLLCADNLLAVHNRQADPVNHQLDLGAKKRIMENRQRLHPIIETVILCGRQSFALRGHDESESFSLKEEPTTNDGNFRALLRYRAKGGDETLKRHFESCGGNYKYISPQIQNEIIDAINVLMLKELVNKINEAKCFAILADETADISGIEQFSICARYLDEGSMNIREDFLQFVPIYNLTGKNLASVLISHLNKFGIKLQYLRGQGYDGAASMSGRFSGVQTYIKEKYPLAPYVHCGAHSLNLAISDACSEASVRNCIGTVGSVHNFINTPKRLAVLQAAVEKLIPSSNKSRLKHMCPTRWIERHDSVLIFLELLLPVVDALETISEWPDRESAMKANHVLCAIKQADFIISLHVIVKVFAITLPLCRFLQTENIDLVAALDLANEVEDSINGLRDDAVFKTIYESAEKVMEELGFSITIPRRVSKQKNRCNVETDDPEEYFRISLFLPFVDHTVSQIHDRLLNHRTLLSGFMCLLPDGTASIPTAKQQGDLKLLLATYSEDLSCGEEAAVGELKLWYCKVSRMEKAPRNAMDALGKCNKVILPTIWNLLKIVATLPVTTSTSERSFSTLRRLKTYLRNTTGEDRLNGLAVMNIHKDIRISVEEVIDELAKKPRRLNFILD